MNLEQQLNELREQLTTCSKTLDSLQQQVTSGQEADSNVPDLSAISGYLALGADIQDDELLNKLLKSAMYVVGASGAGLTLLDTRSQKLVFRAAIGDGAEGVVGYEVPLQGSQHGLAFATGEVQASTPLNTDIEAKAQAKFRNVLVAPLLVDEDPIGTISAVNKQNGEHFTPADIDAYRHFADIAALIVRQRMRESNLNDMLQGKGVAAPDLPSLEATEQDRQVMQIMRSLVAISRQQPGLLPLCQQAIDLIANQKR